jgi:hypothetical protein
MVEVALRWISHHSVLKDNASGDGGDSVLIGASNLKHVEQVRLLIVHPSAN